MLSEPKNNVTTMPANTICSGAKPWWAVSKNTKPVAINPPIKASVFGVSQNKPLNSECQADKGSNNAIATPN